MRVVVIGLGIQGKKRLALLGSSAIATVDPFTPGASYRDIADVPLSSYDAAFVCTPDSAKYEILRYLLQNGKHLLVEKPLFLEQDQILELKQLARAKALTCYTAYNHRFEPSFIRMKELLAANTLGALYTCRLFYGNGTARDVRNSPWRDRHLGVLTDLGSHLFDTLLFWFGEISPFELVSAHTFENKSYDHVVIKTEKPFSITLEMSLLSWRNHFTCDLFAEKGSIHLSSLCKWGPASLTLRHRTLPSGRPKEEEFTLVQPDPTWEAEMHHFFRLCKTGASNLDNDLVIQTLFEPFHPLAIA